MGRRHEAKREGSTSEVSTSARRPLRAIVTVLVICAGWCVLLLFALGQWGPAWPAALSSPWSPHAAVSLLLVVLLLVLVGARRWAVFFSLGCLWSLVVVVPVYWPRSFAEPAPATESSLRVIAANVLFNNHPNDESLAWLYEQNADLVGIVECSTPWVSALARSTHRWPHSIAYPEDGTAGGVALFSRFPLVEERSPGAPVGRFHFIEAVASTERGPVRIFVIHPFPPVTPRATTIRDDEIRWFAERCQQRDMPTVVIGDLNETPFGRAYREFVKATGYRSAREIAPFTPTWPAQTHGYPVPATIRIAIDHCFVSPHFMPTNFIVGRDLGSDHMPIVADLRWAR